MKEETLEEVAERILDNNIDGLRDALKDDDLFYFYKGVIQSYGEVMAKCQAKKMYSEEEVLDILNNLRLDSYNYGMGRIELLEWFEQFKKK